MSGGNTFQRHSRLTKPLEFKMVFRKPVVSADRCFKVLARQNQRSCSRLGMAVSKQVNRRATVRNRIKRIIRESFRQHKATLHIDFVVLPRHEAATISNSQLFQSLDRHWARIESRFPEAGTKTQEPESDG